MVVGRLGSGVIDWVALLEPRVIPSGVLHRKTVSAHVTEGVNRRVPDIFLNICACAVGSCLPRFDRILSEFSLVRVVSDGEL